MIRQNTGNREQRETREYRDNRDGRDRDGRGDRDNREGRESRDNYAQRRQYDRAQREQREQAAVDAQAGLTLADLETRSVDDLQDMAKELDISGYSRLKKQDLAFRILEAQTEQQGNIFKKGILEIMEDGFGFLRLSGGFLPG